MVSLTFGVEIECVFAFHESLLLSHLRSTGTGDASSIVKEMPLSTRQDFRRCNHSYLFSRPKYMGWALTTPVPCPDPDSEGTPTLASLIEERRHRFGYRPYGDEILHLARALLPTGTDIQGIHDGKRQTFDQWHVTDDTTIMGVCPTALPTHLGADRVVNPSEWDSHSLELVSRVLHPTPSAFAEIDTRLSALRGTTASSHGAFTTAHCGLHVHIGLAPAADSSSPSSSSSSPPGSSDSGGSSHSPSFDLPTLQHLAYILLTHEAVISALCAPSRRAGSSAATTDLVSNRESLLDAWAAAHPPDTEAEDAWFDAYDAADASDDFPPCPETEPMSAAFVRERVFAESMTLEGLCAIMCGGERTRMVNFMYLLREEGARTVEFRQHEGCLDGEGVKWWVLFLVGLVGLAASLATAEEGSVMWEEGSVMGLWDAMDFHQDGRAFFQAKMAAHEDE